MAICVFILVALNSEVTENSDEFFAVYFGFQGENDVIRTLNKDKTVYHLPPPRHLHPNNDDEQDNNNKIITTASTCSNLL